jgi:hypothetical protein
MRAGVAVFRRIGERGANRFGGGLFVGTRNDNVRASRNLCAGQPHPVVEEMQVRVIKAWCDAFALQVDRFSGRRKAETESSSVE